MTPTQRTLLFLRNKGITCAPVEHWNSFAKVRQDLFGIIDVLALDHERGIVGIQVTTGDHLAERVMKISSEKREQAIDWLQTPGTYLEAWGWRMVSVAKKSGGTKRKWEPLIRQIILSPMGDMVKVKDASF